MQGPVHTYPESRYTLNLSLAGSLPADPRFCPPADSLQKKMQKIGCPQICG